MNGLQSVLYLHACTGRLATMFAAIGTALALTHGSANASDMRWSYYRDLNEDPFQTRLTLLYGMPETDATQFVAQCHIGNRGTYATIDISAEIGSLGENQAVQVEFIGRGFNQVADGSIIRTQNEGVDGASIPVQLDDPLWEAIRSQSILHYNVTGFRASRLGLDGSSAPVARFIDDCREMPSPDTVSAKTPGAQQNDARWGTCDQLRSERSRNSDVPVTVTFTNRSEGYRGVLWIDFNGRPVEYANLNPGESFTIDTFTTHPWMFTDGPGNCLEMFMPQPGISTFDISAPNRDFGPE